MIDAFFNKKICLRMRIIDSHQHFWKFDPIRDEWINDNMKILQRDFLPKDLKPVLTDNGVEGCCSAFLGRAHPLRKSSP